MKNNHIDYIESDDIEFNSIVSNTMVTAFFRHYDETKDVEQAVKVIEDNPILKMRGFINAIHDLRVERNIPYFIISELDKLYPEHRI